MPDLLRTGSDWLEEMRTRHATGTVTYRRGADGVTLSATIGRTVFEVDDGFGVLQKFESRDFLVLADELVLGGSPVLPEAGDRIEEVAGATTYVYEVMAPGKEPAWRYSDAYRRTLRIHTKQVETL